MATTPEIKTRFTIDGMRQAVTGLRGFARTVSQVLSSAGRGGDPLKSTKKGLSGATKGTKDLSKGLKNAKKDTDSLTKSVLKLGAKGTWGGVKLGAGGAALAIGGVKAKMTALSTAALKAAKDSAAALKSISIDAQRIGGSTSDVAVLGYAADLTGTDRDELITQISTLSNEFLTLRENIGKSYDAYSEFLDSTAMQAGLAFKIGGKAGFGQVVGGFVDENLEAMKASLIDAEWRIAQLDAEANSIGIRPTVVKAGDDVIGSARRLSAQYERQQLAEAVDAFKSAQSTQAQALFELEKYGIDLDRAAQGGVEGLLEISDAFQRIQDPSQKARVAMRLFGEDAGVRLIPLLNGGRKAIDEYRKTLENSGAIATRQDIVNAEDYSRAILNLKTATSGAQMTIGRALTPDLTKASQELTAWLIKSREEIAKAAVEAFRDTRVFAEDAVSLFGGNTDGIKTPWLDSVVQKTLALRAVWADVRKQVGLLWEGKNSDYAWINAIRDGLISIKDFAVDAWKVVSGGDAVDFTWLNTARDYVVSFATRFQDAFGMLKDLVASLGEFFKPVLDYLGKDIMTVGLFLGMTRMIGLFSALTAGAGLLFKALGGVFSLAGAAVGAVGGLAGGAVGAAGATAAGLRVALAGVGTALGGLTSAALLLGTTLAGAFLLGQQAAKLFMADTMAAYDKVIEGQAAVIRANDEKYMREYLGRRDETSRDRRTAYWKSQGILQGGWQGKSAAERNLENAQNSDIRIFGQARYSGADAAARYKEDEETAAWMDERYKSAKALPVSKRVQVDLNVAGRKRTLETDETTADGLLRDLGFANRGY
ncbi:hypothetical protein NN6n1_35610 [Shinella zoogloeoides]